MEKIQPVKGTRDFYPDKVALRNYLTAAMRKTSQLFGYEEYDGPILEPFELYAAKSGDELVNQQSFVFEDRGGRKIVLRPELTPTLARMIAQVQQSIPKPIKWFSVGPMWRYEQPQKGRAREFLQWNVDCLGSTSPAADAEVITMAIAFLKSLGLDENDFVIRINDRQWFQQNFPDIDEQTFRKILNAVDKKDKLDPDAFKTYMKDVGFSDELMQDVITKVSAPLPQTTASENLTTVLDLLKASGYNNYVAVDLSVVRGLDYYTGIVFEVRDRKGELRAIGGGGRYENLVEQVGGEPLSGVGFALGDMPIEELLTQANKLPTDLTSSALLLLTVTDTNLPQRLQEAGKLREAGIATAIYLSNTTKAPDIDKQLKYAKQKAIPYALVDDKLITLATNDRETLSIPAIIAKFSKA